LINPTIVEDLQRHQPITGLHQQNGPTISVSYRMLSVAVFERKYISVKLRSYPRPPLLGLLESPSLKCTDTLTSPRCRCQARDLDKDAMNAGNEGENATRENPAAVHV